MALAINIIDGFGLGKKVHCECLAKETNMMLCADMINTIEEQNRYTYIAFFNDGFCSRI